MSERASERLISSNSVSVFLRYLQKLANVLWARSSGNKEASNRENISHLFFRCSKESCGCEIVFVPDVDYFGDPYGTGSNPKKQ